MRSRVKRGGREGYEEHGFTSVYESIGSIAGPHHTSHAAKGCQLIFHKVPVFIIIGCLLIAFAGIVEARPRAAVVSARTRVEVRSASGEVVPWANPRSREPGVGRYWRKCHGRYVREVQAAESQAGYDVVFYGDSIIEAWRGTFMGSSWTPYTKVPKVWTQSFGSKYKAAAFGISGDKVGNLMWRLINKELPVKKSPKVIILLIGTNDVDGGRCNLESALETAERLGSLVNHVHTLHPRAHIVILGLLPKGEQWPNMCTSALQAANDGFSGLASDSSQIHFLDLTNEFLRRGDAGKWEINETLLPDTQHPSSLGMERIAKALEPFIDRLLSEGSPAPGPAVNNPE